MAIKGFTDTYHPYTLARYEQRVDQEQDYDVYRDRLQEQADHDVWEAYNIGLQGLLGVPEGEPVEEYDRAYQEVMVEYNTGLPPGPVDYPFHLAIPAGPYYTMDV